MFDFFLYFIVVAGRSWPGRARRNKGLPLSGAVGPSAVCANSDANKRDTPGQKAKGLVACNMVKFSDFSI